MAKRKCMVRDCECEATYTMWFELGSIPSDTVRVSVCEGHYMSIGMNPEKYRLIRELVEVKE